MRQQQFDDLVVSVSSSQVQTVTTFLSTVNVKTVRLVSNEMIV